MKCHELLINIASYFSIISSRTSYPKHRCVMCDIIICSVTVPQMPRAMTLSVQALANWHAACFFNINRNWTVESCIFPPSLKLYWTCKVQSWVIYVPLLIFMQWAQEMIERFSRVDLGYVAVKFVHFMCSSGRWSLTSMALTQQVPTTVTPTCSWSESMSTIMRLLVCTLLN